MKCPRCMPLNMQLQSGDTFSRFHCQDQEALVIALDGVTAVIAMDTARFMILNKIHPANSDQFSKVWAARDASKALAGFLGVRIGALLQCPPLSEAAALTWATWRSR